MVRIHSAPVGGPRPTRACRPEHRRLPNAAAAAPAPANSRIISQATVTYFSDRLQIVESLGTNKVEVIIGEVPAFEARGLTQLNLSRGAFGQHYFEVVNTGNVALDMRHNVDRSGETATLARGTLYFDANGNGRVDQNETALAPDQSLRLEMGEVHNLIYVFAIRADADLGQVGATRLLSQASSAETGAAAASAGSPLGLVTVGDGTLEIEKTLARSRTEAGEMLTFSLHLRNNSEAAIAAYDNIDGARLQIDGVPATGVLVRDAVPLNTRLVEIGNSGGMQPLYHLRGAPAQTYVSRAPEDLTTVDAVAFYFRGDYPVGRSNDLRFTVLLPRELGTATVRNVALTYLKGRNGAITLRSNPVTVQRTSEQEAQLDFMAADSDRVATQADPGGDTRLRLIAGACNRTDARDEVALNIVSRLTGDLERVVLRETGPNTGVFRSAGMPISDLARPAHADGVMASRNGDSLKASGSCGQVQLTAAIQVRPGGFVFNSVTNAPVADVSVVLVDQSGRRFPERVSDQRGYFSNWTAPAGLYRLELTPSAQFTAPSVRRSFPGMQRRISTGGSYGGYFRHAGGPVAPVDIPVDPFYGIPLSLEKTSDKDRVRTGEFVTFTITARNNMNEALQHAAVIDRLPLGAVVIPGTARLDGKRIADPVETPDGAHRFDLDEIPALGSRSLTYVLRFTTLSAEGMLYNTAFLQGDQAGTAQYRRSADARRGVRIDNEGGVFARQGVIIGSVFADCNGNGLRDGAEEPGVPGVRIVTQEGLMVVTDANGMYSLFGLAPRAHVLALQSRTLPQGARPAVSRVADMGQAGSRLVQLRRGELRSEHFPLEGCAPELLSQIESRRAVFEERSGDAAATLGDLPMDGGSADRRSIRSEAGLATVTQIAGAPEAAPAPATAPAPAESRETLETLVKSLTPELGFVDIEDGARLRRRTVTLRLKGPADLALSLSLNGQAVAARQIGEKVSWAAGNVQAMEAVALRLKPGRNTLVLTGSDPFGNLRGRQEITLLAPGEPAGLAILAPAQAPAVAGGTVPVVIRLLDGGGLPVDGSAVVTLSSRLARWDATDIRPDQPGLQVFVDNGEAGFDLLAPQSSGMEELTARTGFAQATATVDFLPDLEERVMVGVIEGALRLGGAGPLIAEDALNSFEDTTTGLSGALYLKGRIRGDALLTLRYGSDRDTDDRLFRDIRGDEYYPVYGDNSERGFDAQSSGNLFVRVAKGKSYVLYGDIAIEPESAAYRLGGFSTVTTGAKAHVERGRVGLTVFATRTAQRQRSVEFAGRGVAGPYPLDLRGFREGSDRVTILVRDRDNGQILSETSLRRMSDYLLDFFADSILFDVPVPQADLQGNPVSVRVNYEAEGADARRFWLYGAEATVALDEKTRLGMRTVNARGARGTEDRYALQAAFLERELTDRTRLEAEIARAIDGDGNAGSAARARLIHEGEKSRIELEAVHTDPGFAPPGSAYRPGLDLLAVDYRYRLGEKDELSFGAEYVKERGGSETLSGELGLRRQVSEAVAANIGLTARRTLGGGSEQLNLTFGADWQPEAVSGLSLRTQIELPLRGGGQGKLRFAAEYDVTENIRLLAGTEAEIGPEGDIAEFTRSRIGAEYRLSEWLSARTELSGAPGDGGDARLLQGLNATFVENEQWVVTGTMEHSEPVKGDADRLTSLALGAKWQSEDGRWVADADFNHTWEESGETSYLNLGLASRVGGDLTVLGRGRIARDARGGQGRLRSRLRLGAAWRPLDDPRLEALGWYEHRLDEQGAAGTEDHLWSLAASWEANERLQLRGKYAGHISQSRAGAGGDTLSGTTQLLQAGATAQALPERLQLSFNVMRLWDDAGYATSALGAEAGFVLDEGVLLALGYNRAAARGRVPASLYQDGFYLRVQVKLDGSLWDRLDRFLGE